MKQLTLEFERYAKPTRRAAFLAEMERVVPWSALFGQRLELNSKGGAAVVNVCCVR